MTNAQARAMIELKESIGAHNIEKTYSSRLEPKRVFVWFRGEYHWETGCLDEAVIYEDGKVLYS